MQPGKRIGLLASAVAILAAVSCGALVTGLLQSGTSGQQLARQAPALQALDSLQLQVAAYAQAYQDALLRFTTEPDKPQVVAQAGNPTAGVKRYLERAADAPLTTPKAQEKLAESVGELLRTGTDIATYLGKPADNPALQVAEDPAAVVLGRSLTARARETNQALATLRQAHLSAAPSTAATNTQLYFLVGISSGVFAVLLGLLLAALGGVWAAQPARKALTLLKNRQKLPEGKTEFGRLGQQLNQLNKDLRDIEQALEQFGEGNYGYEVSAIKHSETVAIGLKKFGEQLKRLPELERELATTVEELGECKQRYSDKDKALKRFETDLQHLRDRLSAIESSLPIAELDAEGRFVYTDTALVQLAGYTASELEGRELTHLNGPNHGPDFFRDLWETVKTGNTWYGTLKNQRKDGKAFWLASAITPLPKNGGGARYLLAGYEISSLKQSEESLRTNLQQVSDQLAHTRKSLEDAQQEHQLVLKDFQYQKSLENRLVQQNSALQELTRNVDLKSGNVQLALRFITETTAYAILGERVSLWFFTQQGQSVRCLDLYEQKTRHHSSGFEISRSDYPKLFETWQGERVISAKHAKDDPATADLSETYLGPNGIASLLSAPIHLGGVNVGILLVEHQGDVRQWTLDEENFVLSVADIVSLALEQGNRKVMEEELRMTLEESQALEEELRQNAEEIEATNEEMRRTQVELRGQINALNNAAIVAETNIHGAITYANLEFAKVYGFDRKSVLGQNHRILKSDLHSPAFYEHMWQTIESGKIWRGEVLNRTQSGENVWALLIITPVVGFDGKPYKYIGVSFNITSQKGQELQLKQALTVALDQEQQLMSANEDMRRTQVELAGQLAALNNSSMVYETDLEGNITYVNDRLIEFSGYSRADLEGNRYTLLKSGTQPDSLYTQQWKTILKGQIWQGELELKTKDGRRFWVVATITPVLDTGGEVIKSINVLVDITQQKSMEFRLKKQQSALLSLTAHPAIKEGNIDEAFQLIVRQARETLGAIRAALWLYESNSPEIRCVAVDETELHTFPLGTTIKRDDYPVYFRTLERDRLIAAADALRDPRTRELADTVFQPKGISAVLDATIRQGGSVVGVLSIEHRGPVREWSADEQTFITSLADTSGLALEQKERLLVDRLKLAYSQLEEKNQEVLRAKAEIEEQAQHLTHSIRYAKRIQKNILPAKEFIDAHLDNWFVIDRPKDIVGGDFHWFSHMGGKNVIVIADGTGHGVPGAFMTLIGYLLLNDIVNQSGITRPADILYQLHIRVRTALKQDEEGTESRDGMDVAICTYDPTNRVAEYAGANLPFNYYEGTELISIRADKKSIGGEQMEEERIFTNHTVQLKPGDAVYLYTDGFIDQLGGPEEKRFSTRRFRDLVLRTQQETMSTQRALINLEWKEWKDDREQLDDVTLFGFKVS